VLLTRAPLNHSRITTQMIPCDLHVLNTPPAFVLSQNQTLRKNDLFIREASFPNFKPGCWSPGLIQVQLPRTIWSVMTLIPKNQWRAAHNLIFFLFSAQSPCLGLPDPTCVGFGTIAAEPYCQRACFEGTKKPIGWFTPRSTVCLSVALRRGDGRKLSCPSPLGQSIL
jgi:hypothetical protein